MSAAERNRQDYGTAKLVVSKTRTTEPIRAKNSDCGTADGLCLCVLWVQLVPRAAPSLHASSGAVFCLHTPSHLVVPQLFSAGGKTGGCCCGSVPHATAADTDTLASICVHCTPCHPYDGSGYN